MCTTLTCWFARSSIQAVDVEAVAVTVKELVSYALTLNANNQSWLITQADIYFGEDEGENSLVVSAPDVWWWWTFQYFHCNICCLVLFTDFRGILINWKVYAFTVIQTLCLYLQWPISIRLHSTFTFRLEPFAQTFSPKLFPLMSTPSRQVAFLHPPTNHWKRAVVRNRVLTNLNHNHLHCVYIWI